ncbi:hypothetical protein ACQP2Y_21330 [Actinoplanes sp. CA-051413]|uniref:hypothetical protein n=1 Tax=Actinoplanes sp. CA-051413 TaxID=3239899 RepID=UPI003D9559AB
MRTPAETRAFYPARPGTAYDLMFCDGVKVCDDVERITIVADSDDQAVTDAQKVMLGRPGHEVGSLTRPVRRGHSVWVADFADQGAAVEADNVTTAWDLHREFHGCGVAR